MKLYLFLFWRCVRLSSEHCQVEPEDIQRIEEIACLWIAVGS